MNGGSRMNKNNTYEENPETSEGCSNEAEEEKYLIDAPLNFSFGSIDQEGSCQLYREHMIIIPEIGEKLVVNYRSILGILGEDYIIQIQLTSYEKLVLYALGYKYEDFLRTLISNRNELIIKDMLMYESKIYLNIESEFSIKNKSEVELQHGECTLRLYETGLLIIPTNTDPVRIPYSVIDDIER
jgi:hypothetical protein